MNNATKRTILRWIHLIFVIPVVGYVYSPFADLPDYAPVTRFVAIPVLILSGFWMYSGVVFAVIGVAVWLGAYYLSGIGAAILSQVALFIARKIWMVIQARRSKGAGLSAQGLTPCEGNGCLSVSLAWRSETRSMTFAIKAEISDLRAESFAFSAQKTMYGGKRIAKGDTIFGVRERERRRAGSHRERRHHGQSDRKKTRSRPANSAGEHHHPTDRTREAAPGAERAQTFF
jgi:hypothetical protein